MPKTSPHIKTRPFNLWRNDAGGVTAANLVWLVIFIGLGGLAVDGSNAWRIRAMLQVAADSAAHGSAAAMAYNRSGIDYGDPTETAKNLVSRNLTERNMQNVLADRDVEYGTWIAANKTFVPDDPAQDAVRVTLRRSEANNNRVGTFFLKVIDFDYWNIEAQSVARIFETRRAECYNPILTARTRVDLENINAYVGICVRADITAEVAEDGEWLPDKVVDTLNAVLADNALSIAPSLLEVAGLGLGLNLDLFNLLEELTTSASANAEALLIDAVANADAVITMDDLELTQVAANQSLHVTCESHEVLTIPAGITLPGVTLFSDCPVRIDENVELSSTIIISNLWSLLGLEVSGNLPTGVAINSANSCGPGDGARILVFVDIAAAARIQLFDLAPFSDVLAAAELGTTAEATSGILSAGLNLTGDLLTDVVLEDLAGLCLGAEFMLETSAVAFAN